MRVAHLSTVDNALRYLLLPQLVAIRAAGSECVGISGGGRYVEDLTAAGIDHIALNSSTRGMSVTADFRAAWELWRVLRREHFDILHTHNPKPGLYGRVLGRLAGIPIVINTVHGLYATEDHSWLKRLFVYCLEALASRFSDMELVQSSEDLALITRLKIAPRHRARLLGNGIDVSRFDPGRFSEDHRLRIRASLGFTPDQIVVGMVGRLVAEKGYPELFEAAAMLGDRCAIIALGHEDPDKHDALRPSLLKRGEDSGVRFLGMQDDIDQLYAAMDIFVLPSHREGIPRAAMEAAAMSLPIVATNIRGCREVVKDGVNGLLIPLGSVPALVEAIAALAGDADLRHRMGNEGYRIARELFDERRVVQTVLDAYEEVARRKGLTFVERPSGGKSSLGQEGTSLRDESSHACFAIPHRDDDGQGDATS